MNNTADIAIIGLGTMGASLARNFVNKGWKTQVYNRSLEKTRSFMQAHGQENLTASETLEDLVQSLQQPRKIIMMVSAGDAVDAVLLEISSLLDKGDILVDGGNSH